MYPNTLLKSIQILGLILLGLILSSCQEAVSEEPTPSVQITPTPTIIAEIATPRPTIAIGIRAATTPTSDIILPEIDPLEVTGDVSTYGSSTVMPLVRTLYRRFIREGYPGVMAINEVGTGLGLELYCTTGEIDIASASRKITANEREACAKIDRAPIEFLIGVDALSIVVNVENDFVQDVTIDEVRTLFTARRWSDVRPEWPNQPIERFIPNENSGTFNFFVDNVFDGDTITLLDAQNTESNSTPELVAQNVGNSSFGLGFVGHAFFKRNNDALKIVAIDGNIPSKRSVTNETYPLIRPLYLYSDLHIISEKPQVRAYLNFFLNHVNEEIDSIGYFPIRQDILDESKIRLVATRSGDISITGSTTISPIIEVLAERFREKGAGNKIFIDRVGSVAGLERFCTDPTVDIVMASRRIRDEENNNCANNDRIPIEFRIGTDAVAVIANPANTFLEDTTVEELDFLFTRDKWTDVDEDYWDEPIIRFIPSPTTGTFDFFTDRVFLEGETEPILEASNTIRSIYDEAIVQGVADDPNGLGFVAYSTYQNNADLLKIIAIDGVRPGAEVLDANAYALSRPLFIYVDSQALRTKPQVASFVTFVITRVNEDIENVGYFPVSQETLDQAKAFLWRVMGAS